MTDEKYLFEQTSRERKRNARGSFAKKGGSRSKRCSLPLDNMTAKQRKELNGAVETINLNKAMSYDEWAKLNLGLKHKYIEALYTMHHARLKDIAMMFGRRENNLVRTFAAYSIDYKALGKKSKAYKKNTPSPEWESFLANSATVSESEPEVGSQPVEEENVAPGPSDAVKHDDSAPTTLKPIRLDVVSGSINYIGDPYAVFEKALLAIDPSKEYHFQIRFKEVTE